MPYYAYLWKLQVDKKILNGNLPVTESNMSKQGTQFGAFSGPKTRPAAVAKQTGWFTWIFFVSFDKSPANFSIIYAGGFTSDVSFKL